MGIRGVLWFNETPASVYLYKNHGINSLILNLWILTMDIIYKILSYRIFYVPYYPLQAFINIFGWYISLRDFF